jgi:hypothetical protein
MPEAQPDPSAEVLWLDGLRAGSHNEVEATALSVLDAATALALAGNYQAARQLCATVIFQAQPLMATRPSLLRATLYTLLVGRGFKLMSNVVRSVSGRGVDVTLLPDGMDRIEPPRCYEEARRFALVLHPQWLSSLSPNDLFLQRWCEVLVSGEQFDPALGMQAAASLHLEPI